MTTSQPQDTVIRASVLLEPSHGWRGLGLRELWAFRELAGMLVERDLRVRYKQTIVGVGWAIFQPCLQAAVFTAIFGMLVRVPSEGLPYAPFVLAGLLPWQLTAKCISEGSTSLVANQSVLTKVYFPRLLMPLLPGITGLVDLLCALPALFAVTLWFGLTPSIALVTLPIWMAISLLCGWTVAIWVSALDVRYRDVRFLLTPLTMVWLYATPIIYPASLVPEQYRTLYALNPMATAVEGFRWVALGGASSPPELVSALCSTALLLVAFTLGLANFARMERAFADRL